jgi:sugar fermentation stimulation protein A
MQFPEQLVRATLVSRPNRFLAIARVKGREAGCFLANSGRLSELLRPGTPVWLIENTPEGGRARKTRWDLVLVRHGEILVSVDTRVVNRLVPEAIRDGAIPSLRGLGVVKAEYPFLGSRLDFLARDSWGPVLLEAKSCTLVEGGVALFPDAPTARGRRHLGALTEAVRMGMRAMVVVVVQREDAGAFSPHDAADPEFGRAFREALAAGVEACAFSCRGGRGGITPYREIPVITG